ncbi:MAG: hypothetical protein WDO13_19430 [Verrucomicrobiota bacterium]
MTDPLAILIGWALVHFLWQGVVLALALEIALALAGPRNAALRHALCGVALAAMPVCFAVTCVALGRVPESAIVVGRAVAGRRDRARLRGPGDRAAAAGRDFRRGTIRAAGGLEPPDAADRRRVARGRAHSQRAQGGRPRRAPAAAAPRRHRAG